MGTPSTMVAHSRLIIAFLIVAVLGSGAIAIRSTQSATGKSAKSLSENHTFLLTSDPNFSTEPTGDLSAWELFYKMMLAVLITVVLGVAAIYVSKKFVPRITNLSARKMHIIETVHLGPRKAVHLLKIGEQQLLIGSSNENITKLADVTGALERDDSNLEAPDASYDMDS